ncbi:ATP-binding cassette domain-containing protein [Devosia sp. SD17-2]|uniref:ATP-binding cassette domain-containing protein n=1 Tax=Devosia sp. SD17-2 TaxID=2976459 RepID=UPI0023D7D925|nr:ATP-binding cassette domain-containing protein [Devosia sp. SD17-2]WEJ35022.1 ATP-binding cassette domain-containing protein [Devosia sp. SD17-2]
MPVAAASSPVTQSPTRPDGEIFLTLKGITKSYGPTLANSLIDLNVARGEVIGLVGGNGAGKSTLMKILCGVTAPTLGEIAVCGESLSFATYDTASAQAHGVRMVHQELSLCTNLSVAENFFIESPGGATPAPGWRRRYRERAQAALDDVFPDHRIDVDAAISRLNIGERQMVEIARACATPGVQLIILDEPTSSLGPERSGQLRSYVSRRAAEGMAFIFISHKLNEVIEVATTIALLRNGKLVWRGAGSEASVEQLVSLMGGAKETTKLARTEPSDVSGETLVTLDASWRADGGGPIELRRGETIGLAGLEGSGQAELLHAIFEGNHSGVKRQAAATFVAGDRKKEGIFPLWDVLSNISIGRLAKRSELSWISASDEQSAAVSAASKLRLDPERMQSGITELSGGNQQKALVARSLVNEAPIILLDDPMRGVDIATKQDFYSLIDEIVPTGRTAIWHTTEDRELLRADRVLVLSHGKIVRELVASEISEASIVEASFSGEKTSATASGGSTLDWRRLFVTAMPYISLAAVFSLMVQSNPMVATAFGLDLLLLPAVALALVAIAQMFIVGGSEIDLGAGAFAGLISVLSATLLFDQPLLGVGSILLAVLGYAAMGAIIQARKIPAIVVTLGASFIWLGIGLSIQPTPGGSSPAWLSAIVSWSFAGIPTAIILLAIVAAVALFIDRTPLGVALRGFGNNPAAMTTSGWSALRYSVIRYLIAGAFACAAGMMLTAVNTASDINSGNSYTLLSVAAVVMGGCALFGGLITPLGVVVGAVTLSLIGALLGILNVSSDFNAATQGGVLLAILALRSLASRDTEEN